MNSKEIADQLSSRYDDSEIVEMLSISFVLFHDLNNVLTTVLGCSEVLQRKVCEDDPARRPVDQLASSIKKAHGMIQEFQEVMMQFEGESERNVS